MSEATIYRNALPAAAMLQEYRLESVLGAGAFGITYLARDTHLDKDVAIKEYLPADLAVRALDGSVVPVSTDHGYDYQWGLERFLLEARTLARFSHPNIVRVNRYFEANGTACMVMDYERGASLARLLGSGPPPDEVRLRAMVLPLLDGLEAVHAAGFLHRDIKPANIFIRENGSPVLLDFGASRQALSGATRTLTAVLTPGYAPLEQYSSDGNQGPWSDLYALAGVIYRALTNENPPDAVSRMRNDTVPARLRGMAGRVDRRLLDAVSWALAPDEKNRPQSVAAWRRAFPGEVPAAAVPPTVTLASPAAIGAPPGSTAPTASRRRPEQQSAARQRTPWRRAGAVIAIVAVVATVALWHRYRALPPAAPAAIASAAREPAAGRAKPQSGTDARAERPPRERLDRPDGGERDMAELRKRALHEFRGADADGDGFLSRDEASRFPVVMRTFERVDADGDGRISAPEFVRLRRLQAGDTPRM